MDTWRFCSERAERRVHTKALEVHSFVLKVNHKFHIYSIMMIGNARGVPGGLDCVG